MKKYINQNKENDEYLIAYDILNSYIEKLSPEDRNLIFKMDGVRSEK